MNSDKRRLFLLLSVILATPLITPLLSTSSGAQPTNQMETQAPTMCIDGSVTPTANEGQPAELIGTVAVTDAANTTVRIEFEAASNRLSSVESLQLRFDKFSNVTATEGFSEKFDKTFNWDGSPNPWIEYRVETVSTEDYEIDLTGQPQTKAIVPLPAYGGGTPIELQAADQGVIGSRFAYLGTYETASTKVGCQEITLITPNDTTLPAPPEEILSTLAETARRLPVGHAYEDVRVFVSPTSLGTVGGYVRGRTTERDGGPEIVIDHKAPYNGPEEFVWRHEYIHTRQDFDVESDLQWFREASANYLSYRTALDTGVISPREYDGILAERRQERFSNRLATNSTGQVAYRWGPVVLSRVDARLRSTTNRTIVDTFA